MTLFQKLIQHIFKGSPMVLGLVLVFSISNELLAQTVTFNSSGTFTVPHKITSLHVQVWGAGGGGGFTGNNQGAGGGGGGAYLQINSFPVSAGDISVTVGLGGNGQYSGVAGVNGGNSIFGTLVANGGLRAVGPTGGLGGAVAASGDILNSGGNGSNGPGSSNSAGGGGGAGAGPSGTGESGAFSVGGSGANGGGRGGDGGPSSEGVGLPGEQPGGGGGGEGRSAANGGTGGNGQIIVSWTCSNSLTSAASTNNQTVCEGTGITDITYQIAGAYGATFSGIPAGVTATYTNGDVTISGTPTTPGTYNYTITPTGGCTTNVINGTISVTANNIISAPSTTPTLCINSALTNITHTTTGATGIGASTGLPAGVSAVWAANTITISGTPTASGTFNYSVPLTGGCAAINATGTITVNPNNKITPVTSVDPTQCINVAINDITFNTTGATGITSNGIAGANGLPAGVSAAWNAGVITISGTPTTSGSFPYSIPLTGGCGTFNATGTITVTPDNTASAPTSTPTLCINSSLIDITHSTTGATGISNDGASGANDLPAGLSATWVGNVITISGTPTTSGTYNYSIPLTGGCGTVNATGTITVTPDNTASAPSSTPTLCIETPVNDITHTTTGATGIGVASGLPAGVTANWAANTITISGTPTESGTFNYSIPLTDGCGTVNATGTITVAPNNTVSSPSSSPTLCANTQLTDITHSTTGATGISNDGVSGANGLPAGVNAYWAGNVITISGTPTQAGTFNYSIPLIGGCLTLFAEGTITVNPASSILSENLGTQSICDGQNFSSISINASGTGTLIYQWYSNIDSNTTSGTPIGSNLPTYTPSAAAIGILYYYVEVSSDCGPIAVSNVSGAFTVDPITSITIHPNSLGEVECFGDGFFSPLSVSAIGGGLTYQWYKNSVQSISGGISIPGANSPIFTPRSTPVGSTYYYAVVTGNCGIETSTVSGEYIVTPPKTIITQDPNNTPQTICLGDTFSTLSVLAIGEGPVTYKWYRNTSISNFGGTLIPGETNPNFTPTASTVGTTYYYATASSDCGTVPTEVSGAFTVTPLTEIESEDLTGQTICDGDSFDPISVNAIGTGTITYQWFSNTSSSNSSGTLIPSETNSSFTPPATAPGTTTYYYVEVYSECGPDVVSSVSAPVTVNPLTSIQTQPSTSNQTVCPGDPFSVISVDVTGPGSLTYQWFSNSANSNSGGVLISGAEASSFSPPSTTTGATYYYVEVTSNCETVTSNVSGAFNVNQNTQIDSQDTGAQTACIGLPFNPISVEGSGTGTLTYQWFSNLSNSNTGGNPISGETLSTYTPPSSAAATTYYYVVVSSDCGPAVTSAVSGAFLVNPEPTPTFDVSPGALVCEQSGITYTTQSSKSNYIWTIPGNPGVDYTITAGGSGSTNESVTIEWLTTGSKTVTVSYTEPSTGCIASTSASSTTTVEPFFSVGPTSVAFPSVCISSPALVPFTQSTTGVSGIGIPTGLPSGITAIFNSTSKNIEFSGTVTGATTGLFSYSIPLIGNCVNGLQATGTIEVTPEYIITAVSSVSATTIGGSASVTFYGNPVTMLNGTYQIVYQIKQGSGVFTKVGPVNATVVNGKGTFSTTPVNSGTDTYTVQILTIKKSTDVCTVTLPVPLTTYFGVCSAVFGGNSTFYVPANVYSITIEVYGGGGGGNNGGGGGGSYTIRQNIPVTPGEPLAVFIGNGGGKGLDGGVSYVTRDSNIAGQLTNSLVLANGGKGSTTGNAAGGTFDPRFSGSNGNIATGNNGGKGGGPLGGSGGGSAINGSPPGGGGGSWSGTKGVGGTGLVIISYSCPDAVITDCIKVIDDGSKSGMTVLEFTCDYTWTAPEGLYEFTTYVGSAGGGGGSGEGSGGGGSGSLIQQTLSTTSSYGLPAGSNFTITVGLGGLGAQTINANGFNGFPTSFSGSINGSAINISVAGGGGGGSQSANAGGNGSSGGGGGASPAPAKSEGIGGAATSITYTGTAVVIYQGNVGGNGDYSEPQNSVAGGGGGGLIPWKPLPADDGQNGKAAGNGQGEGGRGGDGRVLTLGDSLRYFGAGGGGVGRYFNGTDKIGLGGSAGGIRIGGSGNLNGTNPVGNPGVNKTGSGGGSGYYGGGKGGSGIVYITFVNGRILPVEYLYFNVEYNFFLRSGDLTWSTGTESKNARFEIERSVNNVQDWETIGQIPCADYDGQSVEYTFQDMNLPLTGGNLFYRLKKFDFDGEFGFSDTKAIRVEPMASTTSWRVYPNPSTGNQINLEIIDKGAYNDEKITVRIVSISGQFDVIENSSPSQLSTRLSDILNSKAAGIYTFEISWGDQREYHKVILRR